jgi:hypothetical protein
VIAVSKFGLKLERWVWLLLVTSVVVAAPAKTKTLEFKSGLLTVTLQDARDQAQLATVFKTFKKAQADLAEIGLVIRPVKLEAFSSANAFARATGEPVFVAASTQAQTIRTQRLGALKTRGLLEFTIRHEVFHTAQPASLPRWLAEGLARHFSGEDARDSSQPSGLESVSKSKLDELMLARGSSNDLNLVYLEATRRAVRLIRTQGWKPTLETK